MKQISLFSIVFRITLSVVAVFFFTPLIVSADDSTDAVENTADKAIKAAEGVISAVGQNAVVFPNPFDKQPDPVSVDEARARQIAEEDIVSFAQERFGELVGTLFGFLGALSIIPIVVGGFQLMVSQGGAYADKGKKTLYWGFVGLLTGLFGYLVFGFLLNLLIQT